MHATTPPVNDAGTPWPGARTDHYENFPVGSWLVPAPLRPAVAAIYRFARYADDVADEGSATADERLAELRRLGEAIDALPEPRHPAVTPLAGPIAEHRLDRRHLHDLLSAFSQDVRVRRHASLDSLLDYCDRSANPVGRLMLELFDCANERNIAHADAICSALQLINFAQDVAIDWRKDRVYLPQDALRARGLRDDDIDRAVDDGRAPAPLRAVIGELCASARAMLVRGRPLLNGVPRRLSWELRVILAGGTRVLDRLQAGGFDPIAARPVLGPYDAAAIARLTFASPPAAR
ncbi:MAG: squalene synthase HpnC [Burkholderiaceae bacterium]